MADAIGGTAGELAVDGVAGETAAESDTDSVSDAEELESAEIDAAELESAEIDGDTDAHFAAEIGTEIGTDTGAGAVPQPAASAPLDDPRDHPRDHPRVRVGAITWGLIVCVIAATILAIVTDPARTQGVATWIGEITPGNIWLIVLIGVGALTLLIGLASLIGQVQRSRGRTP